MNVLSIDFDYFQRVSEDVLKYFPDGIDLPTKESELEWKQKYRLFGDKLATVGLLKDEYELLKQILSDQQDIHVPVLIANSHFDIYEFIKEQQQEKGVNRDVDAVATKSAAGRCRLEATGDYDLRVVNVDMHHDIFNDHNEIIDCGNWVGALQREMTEKGYKMSLQWVVNPVSLKMYGLEEDIWDKITLPSLDKLKNQQFDMIFLCRSDMWLAPHLDMAFTEICDLIDERFVNVEMRDDVDLPRKVGAKLVCVREKFERE